MDPVAIKAFVEAVGAASRNMDYREFCRRLGLDWKTANHAAEMVWRRWEGLCDSLKGLSVDTLQKLLAREDAP